MSLGQNIRIYREQLGMSQSELASALGYKDRSTIAKIENGTNDLTQSKIAAIAEVLKTSPSALMGWEGINAEQLTDGELSEVKRSLIQFAQSLTDEQAALALRVLRSIVEGSE